MSPLPTLEQMDARRELPRFPTCPPLDDKQIEQLTRLVFVESRPQKADVLFVFGTKFTGGIPAIVAQYEKALAPYVYVCGGIIDETLPSAPLISHLMRDEMTRLGVPPSAFIMDERSTNTLEDAVFGRKLFIEKGIPFHKILFTCKAQHGGRCLRTMRKVFPESALFPFIYEADWYGTTVSEKNWWKDEIARSHVWGEYQRILLYSSRGDIC